MKQPKQATLSNFGFSSRSLSFLTEKGEFSPLLVSLRIPSPRKSNTFGRNRFMCALCVLPVIEPISYSLIYQFDIVIIIVMVSLEK